MIKLVIFDLDGVLVDARELHYEALNRALEVFGTSYVIDREEHLSTYDGLPTKKKLETLTKKKDLPEAFHDEVWKIKQDFTYKIINEEMTYDERLRGILSKLKSEGYIISVASNSIRNSVKMMLIRKGLLEYIDFFYSNQDVNKPKPSSEIYLKCMIKAGVNPDQTIIVEDSHIGRRAAQSSGATLCAVRDVDDVTYEHIKETIDKANDNHKFKPKWQGGNMKVLIPMAGAGSRFEKAGYTFPKPLIDVEGKPMIQTVVDNLNIDAQHIFIVQKSHYEKYNLEVIANSDQYVDWDSNEFMYSMTGDSVDGGILTFKSTHPKWSYAKLGDDGFVCEVAEKKPISDIATVGIYYWRKGSDYIRYAEDMITKDVRVNNEFYVCPVFNQAIEDNKKIKIFNVEKMWGIGTPEDLQVFLKR
jgi:HAD superfamily hydrolase (TIGR01509 family)